MVVDLNGDGRLDVAVAFNGVPGFSVLLNEGDGALGEPTRYSLPAHIQSLAAGDFAGDGRVALVGAGDVDYVCLLPNQGGGVFGEPRRIAKGLAPAVIRAADLDGNGSLDLAVTNNGHVLVLFNNGKGSFEKQLKLRL